VFLFRRWRAADRRPYESGSEIGNLRRLQLKLQFVCDYLGYEGISTHSFRKWYATEIYKANGFDIALVQRLLRHSSAATTQRYIGIEPQRIEQAIQNHAQLI
jgi:site-specific recombinase XerD